jgi:alkylhydroperoxidase/carboxymuconolactone decarboxylase family protein YurZ
VSITTTPDAEAARAANLARLSELDPAYAQMFSATVGHARAVPELTEREKTFLSVTADVCHASLGSVFEVHVRTGLADGVSTADIRSLLRFISYDCGYHVAAAGFERLAELEAAHGIAPVAAELLADDLVATGPDAAPSPLPDVVRAQIGQLDPHYLDFFDLQSRMRTGHGPGTLTERERGLASLSIDVHYQTLEETFRTHVWRVLNSGATREDVRAALRFNAQFGATRAWRAWKALNAYFAGLDSAD